MQGQAQACACCLFGCRANYSVCFCSNCIYKSKNGTLPVTKRYCSVSSCTLLTVSLLCPFRQQLWQEQGERTPKQRHCYGSAEEESVRAGQFSMLPACESTPGGDPPDYQSQQGGACGGRDWLWKNNTGGCVGKILQHFWHLRAVSFLLFYY